MDILKKKLLKKLKHTYKKHIKISLIVYIYIYIYIYI